jgi:hypothetical protein
MPACMRREPWKRLSGRQNFPMWHPISIAPFDRNLELAIIDSSGVNAFFLPCCRILWGWCDAKTRRRVDVKPTHWREWAGSPSIWSAMENDVAANPKCN